MSWTSWSAAWLWKRKYKSKYYMFWNYFFQTDDFQVIIIYYCFTGFKQNFISEWQWISYIYQRCSNINTQMHMNTHPLNQKRSKSSSLITIIVWQVRKKITDKIKGKFRQYVEVVIMMKIFLKTYMYTLKKVVAIV